MVYGYHRTSTKEQHLDRGITAIEEFCREQGLELVKIYTDQQTGKNFDRPRYKVLTEDILRKGDCLVVSEIDRLGRNKRGTLREIQKLRDMGVRLIVIELPTTWGSNSTDPLIQETITNIFIELYTMMAQQEIEKKEKRQREGIEAKKARGEWDDYGRPRAMKQEDFNREYQAVLKGEIKPFELISKLGLTKATYYRYKKAYESGQ